MSLDIGASGAGTPACSRTAPPGAAGRCNGNMAGTAPTTSPATRSKRRSSSRGIC